MNCTSTVLELCCEQDDGATMNNILINVSHESASRGPGVDRLGWGHLRRLYKAPDGLYKAPTDNTKPLNIKRNLKKLNTDLTYLTKVATNINLT